MAQTANGTAKSVPLFLDGKEFHPAKSFPITSALTGQLIHNCANASVDDAAAAVESASRAFRTWRKVTPIRRRDILFRAAEVLQKRREELVRYMNQETGGAVPWCNFNVDTATELIKDVAGRIATLEGSFPTTMDPNVSGIVMQEPYGVVLAIAPWNAPYILGVRSIVFPLAAGNTAVLKGSEMSPRVMWAIASVFHEAGLPAGVLNTITHEPSSAPAVTSALISNPLVRKVNFTGSTAVGRIIGRLAGEHLKPVVLELGGKASSIVWEDADLDLAAEQCALGSFLNAGQVCMCTERILVHKAIKPQFLEKLSAAIERIFGKGEAPVLINSVAVEKNKKLVADATAKGASVAFGNANTQEVAKNRMRPVVLDEVTKAMDIYATESFGPTVSVFEIDTEEAAIEIVNDTDYGLTAAVFTEDLRRGLHFARGIESGAVHINGMTIHDESVLPHGGVKSSGFGRFNGSSGLREWVQTKTVTFRN